MNKSGPYGIGMWNHFPNGNPRNPFLLMSTDQTESGKIERPILKYSKACSSKRLEKVDANDSDRVLVSKPSNNRLLTKPQIDEKTPKKKQAAREQRKSDPEGFTPFNSRPNRTFEERATYRADLHFQAVLKFLNLQLWIPQLQKHHIGYTQFLNLNEKNLIELGMNDESERKKILDYISDSHKIAEIAKRNNEVAPLSRFRQIDPLEEMQRSLSNIASHVLHLDEVLREMTARIKQDPSQMKNGIASFPIAKIMAATNCMLISLRKFAKDTEEFKKVILHHTDTDEHCFAPPLDRDIIKPVITKNAKSNSYQKYFKIAAAVVTLYAIFALRCR